MMKTSNYNKHCIHEMSHLIDYIQNMSDMLADKLGVEHKYIRMLSSIIKEQDIDRAAEAIDVICQDPVIHKLYFPINIDAVKQAEWCEHVLCGHKCAPQKRLHDVYCLSNQ